MGQNVPGKEILNVPGTFFILNTVCRSAVEEGGTVLCGGKKPEALGPALEDGAFLQPTVIGGLATA